MNLPTGTARYVVLDRQAKGRTSRYAIVLVQLDTGRDAYELRSARGERLPKPHRFANKLVRGNFTTVDAVFKRVLFERQQAGYEIREGQKFPERISTKIRFESAPMDRPIDGARRMLHPDLEADVTEAELPALLANAQWLMQERFTGTHCMVSVSEGDAGRSITACDPAGRRMELHALARAGLRELALLYNGAFAIDGVLGADVLYLADAWQIDDLQVADRPLRERLARLRECVRVVHRGNLVVADSYAIPGGKAAALSMLRERGARGVVFKHCGAVTSEGGQKTGPRAYRFHADRDAAQSPRCGLRAA